MRLLHGADFHGGLTRYGVQTPTGSSRIADFAERLEQFIEAAVAADVDLAILAGDTFHTRREGPEERTALVRALMLAREYELPVVITPGNHDGMTSVGDYSTHSLRWLHAAKLPGVHVLLTPQSGIINTRSGEVIVTSLPYPHKRAFDEMLSHLTPEERVIEAGKRVEGIIEMMAHQASLLGDMPRLFVGHLSIGGAKIGSESTMKFSWDVAVRPEVLAPYDYAALGHIHRQQRVAPNAWYAGSPEYIDFSEAGTPKGYLLAEVVRAGTIATACIRSNARPMLVVEIDERPDGSFPLDSNIPAGAIVRLVLRSRTSRPNADAVMKVVREAHALGASYVEERIVRPEAVARPAMTEERGVLDATREWLVETGTPEEPAMTAAKVLVASQHE